MAHNPASDETFDTRAAPARRVAKKRVQVAGGISTQRIRPQAEAIDQFVQAPGGGPQQSPLTGLASALSGLSTMFKSTEAADLRKAKTEAAAAAERELAQRDFKEIDKLVREGKLREFSSPLHRAAFMTLIGRERGERAAETLSTDYFTNFDKDNGDFDEFVQKGFATAMEGVDLDSQDGIAIQAGFIALYNKKADALRGDQQRRIEESILVKKYQGVLGFFNEADEDGGKDAKSIASFINEFRTGDARRTLNIGKSEFDGIITMFADRLAGEGRLDAVEAILKDTRDGVGSIAGKANKQGARARAIILKAKKVKGTNDAIADIGVMADFHAQAKLGIVDEEAVKNYAKLNPLSMTPAKAISIISTSRDQNVKIAKINRGIAAAMSGKMLDIGHLYTDAERAQIASGMFSKIAADVEAAGGKGREVFTKQLEFAALNNLVNLSWKNILVGAPLQGNILELTKGDEKLPEHLDRAIELYNSIQSANPKMTVMHTDKASRNFYEMVRSGEEVLGMTRQAAVAQVLSREGVKDTFLSRLKQERTFNEVGRMVRDIVNETDGATLASWFGTDVTNTGYIAKTLEEFAQPYIEMGNGAEFSVQEAAKRIVETHTNINGILVPTNGHSIPSDIQTKAELAIAAYMKAEGLDGDPDQFSIAPISKDNTNVWVVIYSANGMHVPNAAANGTFSLGSLEIAAKNKRINDLERERRSVNVTIQTRLDTSVVIKSMADEGISKFRRQVLRSRMSKLEFRKAVEAAREGRSLNISSDPETGEVEISIPGGSRGELNNNPGNISRTPESLKFFGVSKKQSDDRFLQFDTEKSGIRATARNLRTYQSNGFNTLDKIINRWAPVADGNDTEAYIRDLEQRLGIGRDEVLDLRGDDELMLRVVKAIFNHELGSVPYSDSMIANAINSAKRSM